jgi:hypothetical protein
MHQLGSQNLLYLYVWNAKTALSKEYIICWVCMLYIFGEFHDTFSYIAIMIGVYTALCGRNDVLFR